MKKNSESKTEKTALSKENKKAPKRSEVRKLVADSSDEEPLINKVVKKDVKKKRFHQMKMTPSAWFAVIFITRKVRVTQCKMWIHALCAKNDPFYVCINCAPEYSDEFE